MWLTLFVRRVVVVCCILLLLLVGCAPEKETVAPATRRAAEATAVTSPVTATATATAALATATAAAPTAVTPAPTLAPTPALIPSVTADPLVLSPENAAAITQIAQFGKGTIDAISWSPDGATFAVAASAGIDLYDVETWQEVRSIGAGWPVQAIHFIPQGEVLAAVGCYQLCWTVVSDAGTGQQLWERYGTDDLPHFTSDGQVVTIEYTENGYQLRRQGVYTGQVQVQVTLRLEGRTPSAYSPDGKTLVDVVDGATLRLLDATTGEVLRSIDLPNVGRVAYSPDGSMLAVSGADNRTWLWGVESGELLYTLEGNARVYNLAFSPDGSMLAVSSEDDRTRLWDVESGELLYTLEGNAGGELVFSPDGRTLAVVGDYSTVRLWDTATGQLLHSLMGGQPAFSSDGSELAVVSGDSVSFFAVADGQLLRTLTDSYSNPVSSIAFSPDGLTLAVATYSKIRLWDVNTRQLRQTVATNTSVTSVAFSPDGQTLAWGGAPPITLQLWDLVDNQPAGALEEETGGATRVAFSPDGRLLAAVSDDQTVRLWDAATLEMLFSQPAIGFAFHPDGRLLATEVGSQVQLWDLHSFQLRRTFDQTRPGATFSPDGHLLALTGCCPPQDLGVWDVETGQLIRQLNIGEVGAVSSNGKLLAGIFEGEGGAGLLLWDMRTGQLLRALGETTRSFSTIVFSPDGRLLASGNWDGTARLWGLPSNTAGDEGEAPAAGDNAAPSEVSPCTDDSEFVLDVTVPDGTHFAPGTAFTKTWRLRNSGTCTWDHSYGLSFVSGERMDGPESMSDGTSAIGEVVLPGEEVDISITLVAPEAAGTYRGRWQLVASDGTGFGARPYMEIVVP